MTAAALAEGGAHAVGVAVEVWDEDPGHPLPAPMPARKADAPAMSEEMSIRATTAIRIAPASPPRSFCIELPMNASFPFPPSQQGHSERSRRPVAGKELCPARDAFGSGCSGLCNGSDGPLAHEARNLQHQREDSDTPQQCQQGLVDVKEVARTQASNEHAAQSQDH